MTEKTFESERGLRMKNLLKKRYWSAALVFVLMAGMLASVPVGAGQGAADGVSRYVTVDGRKMHVILYGDIDLPGQDFKDGTKTTLVMLPALGVPSPHIYFKPLAMELKTEFNVVILEPFGYGLSDGTTAERTVSNINSEIKDALDMLEIDQCVLLVHSISGVYGLNFVHDYPESVKGFIAVDNTVYDEGLSEALAMEQEYMLKQTEEFDALKDTFATEEAFLQAVREDPEKYGALLPDVAGYAYSESDEEEYLQGFCSSGNAAIKDEIERMDQSLLAVKDKKFPDDLPVLAMICSDNVNALPAWQTGHENQLNLQGENHELQIVEGSHYIWYTNLSGVTEHIDAWREKNQF